MGSSDSKYPPVTICCNGTDAVHRLVEAAHRFSGGCQLTPSSAAKLAIIVEELVFNLVEHGQVGESGEIELLLGHDADGVTIVLRDTGVAFDLRTAESEEAIPERGGGAGIDLIRAWAEVLDYRSEAGRNRLDLRMSTKPGV